MKMLVFLDELFHTSDQKCYYSNYSSGRFFSDFSNVKLSFMFPCSSLGKNRDEYTTKINNYHEVYCLPAWTSVISYISYRVKKTKDYEKAIRQYEEAVKKNDIIWVRLPSLPGMKIAEIALKQNKKVVFHFAGEIKNAWKNNKYSSYKKPLAYLLSQYMQWKSDKLAKNSNVINLCTGSALLDHYKNLNDNSIFFIDSLVSTKKLTHHIPSKNLRRFIYVGRFTEDKGILLLLDVVKRLKDDFSNFSLKIIGFGPEENNIKQFIKDHKLENNVELIGYVPNNNLINYYKNSDIFVMPSTLSEGFPRVIIEAWANGLAVVSSKVGGISSLGKNGHNILYCEKNSFDGLYSVMSDIMINNGLLEKLQRNILNDRESITQEYFTKIVAKEILGNAL